MAVENLTFAAAISDFVRETKARTTAVFRESVQDVERDMQTPIGQGGNMPVDTGFLRASIRATKDMPLPINRTAYPSEGQTYTYSPSSVSLVIAGLEVGDVLFLCYTAAYAAHQNYGTSSMAGRHFVDLAAQRWPQIVAANCQRLQDRIGQSSGGGR